jgi:enamine deaminase RidA (YjgF/YER057c/UK114 family)
MAKTQTISREAMRPLIEPYGLSEAVRAGNLLFIAGQTGMDETHQIVAGGLKAQAAQAFRNIKAVLAAAGGAPENLASMTWYVVEGEPARSFMVDALEITAARNEVFPGLVTGQTAVRVKGLLTPEMLIEIQAVAAL